MRLKRTDKRKRDTPTHALLFLEKRRSDLPEKAVVRRFNDAKTKCANITRLRFFPGL
jgi:hypothetical protein